MSKKKPRTSSGPPVCSVEWCAAVVYADGLCAVHVAVKECHPVADYQQPDYWRELDEAWDASVAPPLLPDTPEREECGDCEGSGDCACCDGSGTVECQNAHCRRIHDCDSCDGDGQCADCSGTGYDDGEEGEQKKSDVDALVDRWLKNRPSARKQATA